MVKRQSGTYPVLEKEVRLSPPVLAADMTYRAVVSEFSIAYLGLRALYTRDKQAWRGFVNSLRTFAKGLDLTNWERQDFEDYLEQADYFDNRLKAGLVRAVDELARKVGPKRRLSMRRMRR